MPFIGYPDCANHAAMAKKGLLAAIAASSGGETGRLWIQNGLLHERVPTGSCVIRVWLNETDVFDMFQHVCWI